MISIGKALARLFPNLPQSYPTNGGDAEPMWASLARSARVHRISRPLSRHRAEMGSGAVRFQILRQQDPRAHGVSGRHRRRQARCARRRRASPTIWRIQFFDNNETEGEGGYYPVGPYGESRLWHGGVHLRADKGTPVYAPFAGKMVAARMTDDWPVGSRNFVLISSDLPVGSRRSASGRCSSTSIDESTTGNDAPAWYAQRAVAARPTIRCAPVDRRRRRRARRPRRRGRACPGGSTGRCTSR